MTQFTIKDPMRLLRIACGFCVIGILVAKIPLIWRININWDEFYFLSHVHSLARGDLDLLLQGAYTHLFVWSTWLGADEIVEIDLLRLSMWPLLALACFLLYRLARHWASSTGAWFAVFAFVASWPVLRHGLAFRVDSLLLPLTLAALLLASRGERHSRWDDVACGIIVGLAMILTIKASLLLPTLMAVLYFEGGHGRSNTGAGRLALPRRLAVIAGAGGITIALVLVAHASFIAAAADRPEAMLSRAWTDAILYVPWFPRWNYFRQLLDNDLPTWILLGAGLVVAVARKRYGAAACASSLLPILFYRNAFPYYYVVMMAPACVVIAVAIDEVRASAARPGWHATDTGVTFIVFLLLAHGAWNHLMALRFDEQARQRSVIAAVHRIFPTPVPYIDHSGMISSFRKANFFMSAWGMQSYASRGKDFMPGVLATQRPPLLVANHPALVPRSLLFRRLSETDQSLIRDSYVDYWGPVRIAGTKLIVPPEGVVMARLPFAGQYRVESPAPILIDGQRHSAGDRIAWRPDSRELAIRAAAPGSAAIRVTIVWAAAREPPKDPPPTRPLYSGL